MFAERRGAPRRSTPARRRRAIPRRDLIESHRLRPGIAFYDRLETRPVTWTADGMETFPRRIKISARKRSAMVRPGVEGIDRVSRVSIIGETEDYGDQGLLPSGFFSVFRGRGSKPAGERRFYSTAMHRFG